jgi:diaminohydroxyphosphoribosylaminopyrimidine deaminase/5-amino-6-(5-phosphoribosylamino)uracil reductase
VASEAETAAMRRALALAVTPGVPLGPNPRVGCVLLDPAGSLVAEGYHRGAGTAHAEVDALAKAGDRAGGATAVVTLEPCAHTGRTGPCADALVGAGVRRVVFAQSDESPVAGGGAQRLREAGVGVEAGLLVDEATALNPEWTFAATYGRPFVTWKLASSLDGRVAAADGTSRWITGEPARADVHAWRARCDAVLVGTGTVLADDPHLTVRDPEGQATSHRPLRVVMGLRDVPADSRVLDDAAPTMHLRTRDPRAALTALATAGVAHVYLEGGPGLAGAFVQAGLVDRVIAYYAGRLIGSGPPALEAPAITTLANAPHLAITDVAVLGADVRLTATCAPSKQE